MWIVHENMKYYRMQLHLTQQNVADMLNVDRTTYTSYETHRIPSLDILIKLCKIFAVSLDELAGINQPLALNEEINIFYKHDQVFDKYLTHDERMLLFSMRLLNEEQLKEVTDLVTKYAKENNELGIEQTDSN